MAERRGVVWHGDRRVGALREEETHGLRFAYDPDWLAHDGFPISISLPLSQGDREVEAHAFFEGLLPEGRVRQRICRQKGIDPRDDAGLLLAIGEDCAGALSILPAGVAPEYGNEEPEPLTAEQLEELVRSRGSEPAMSGTNQRFSLAGVQEKQPVIFDGRTYALPNRANPSSHILKFETLPRVCFAEFTATEIASTVGLPVVEMEFLQTDTPNGPVPWLRIERFDRIRDQEGRLVRLHQEDLLQALGEPTAFKYQRDGGPSIRIIAEVLREHSARPVEVLSHLRDWQILNTLIGNWDGHAKNLAFLYRMGQSVPDLAPFYDLVAIEFFNRIRPGSWSRDMAIHVGENFVPERITRSDWEQFAHDLGMPQKTVLARLEELANQIPGLSRAAREAFAEAHADDPAYDYLEETVRNRCRWVLNSVFAAK